MSACSTVLSWMVVVAAVLLFDLHEVGAQTNEVGGSAKQIIDSTGGLPIGPTAEHAQYRVIKLRPQLAVPNSKSRLFPDRSDLRPGNAAPIFLRQNFEASTAMEKRREFLRAEPGPLEKALNDPRILEVEGLNLYRVGELERAAYREHSGWEYPLYEPQYEDGGIQTRLPDVQEMRICALYLSELARAAIARNDSKQAERYIRIGLGLAQHLADTPFMVVKMVSAAHCGYHQFAIEELIQLPGGPNYYWDLTSLPRPLVEPRDALQWEWNILPAAYPELLQLDALESNQQWRTLHDKIVAGLIGMDDGRMPKAGSPQLEELMKSWSAKSREMLPKLQPSLAERVPGMSDAEASVRYWWLRVQQLQNLLFAPGLLEPQYAIGELAKRERQVAEMFVGEEFVLSSIMPTLTAGQFQFVYRKEQRFAQLRVIESIRHWSAEHSGQLPATLSELTLPAPIDPLAGKPFEYTRAQDGRSAELTARSVNLPKDQVNFDFVYRLVLE